MSECWPASITFCCCAEVRNEPIDRQKGKSRPGAGKGGRLQNTDIWDESLTGNVETDVRAMNTKIEAIVRGMPEQSFRSYNRYKCPAGGKRPACNDSLSQSRVLRYSLNE